MQQIRATLQGEVAALEADLRKVTMKAGKLAASIAACDDADVKEGREARHKQLCGERDAVHARLRGVQRKLRATIRYEKENTHTMPGLMSSATSTEGRVKMMQTGQIVTFPREGKLAEASCGPVAVTMLLEQDGAMHVLGVENEHPVLEFWGTVERLQIERGFGIIRMQCGSLINGKETILFHLSDLNGRDGSATECVPKDMLTEGMMVSFHVDVKTNNADQWVGVALREIRPEPAPRAAWTNGVVGGWDVGSDDVDWSASPSTGNAGNPYGTTCGW
tara:strand:+ start:118 stop:948 length:831 start_codon:yes stop_codon:yes gene_type:complete